MKPSHVMGNGTLIKKIRLEFIITTQNIEYAIFEIDEWNNHCVDVKKINVTNVVNHMKSMFYTHGDNFPDEYNSFEPTNEVKSMAKKLFPAFYA